MMNAIVIFFRFIFKNYLKVILILFFTLVFLFVLFPLSDLNDLISSRIYAKTGNRVFVQFDDMHLNPITASAGFENVYIETPQLSALNADYIKISPSIAAAFSMKPGGSLVATGFLKGEVEINLSPIKGSTGADKSKIEIVASNISLKEAREIVHLNVPIKGQLNLTSSAIADLTFVEQPEMDLNLTILKFELPSTTVTTASMGSINLPEIKFDKVELKGKLSAGKFHIESGKLGSSKDDFYGDISGEIDLNLLNAGGQIIPQVGNYDLKVDLKANANFQQRAQLFLSFLDSSKTSSGSTANYKFSLKGNPMAAAFQMTPIR